jgi:hypothetical protein
MACSRTRGGRTHLGGLEREPQISPLRSPGFPVELRGVGGPHAPFLKRKAHTRSCPVLRGRKSGYAPVPRHAPRQAPRQAGAGRAGRAGGMTNFLRGNVLERSAVSPLLQSIDRIQTASGAVVITNTFIELRARP